MSSALGFAGNPRALWYLTRGSGLVALLLLTAVLVLGLVVAGRWSRPGWPRFVTSDLHRNLSLLTVVLVAIHVISAVSDPFAPIRWLNAVIPFTGSYRPLWLGFGALASDLLLALIATSLLRLRIGHRMWRGVHWLAYACWPVAVLHGLGTGSDTRPGWAQAITWGCVGAVVAGLAWRLLRDRARPAAVRVLSAVAGVAVAAALGGFALAGPLQPGWAQRAGTPTALLARSVTTAAAPSGAGAGAGAGAASPGTLVLPYSGFLAGTIRQDDHSDGTSTVQIGGTVRGAPTGRLSITLEGQALDNGGVAMTGSQVQLDIAGTGYQGHVVALSGRTLDASLTDDAGAGVLLGLQLNIEGSTVQGTVTISNANAQEGGE
ncbi:MAG TPA: ferric reductase-like transmembrane domain-containing protein [Mycobacteriales bacterium]|nr:ferric reductase-like transmembrane domain-containing protein [Mycobacteriales bacterium]